MSELKTYDPYYAGPVVFDVPAGEPADTFAPAPEPVVIEAKTNEPELVEQVADPISDGDIEVPEGPAARVLEWVGDDRERASAALAAEKSGQARKTLIAKLEGLLEG
jgi:hypothetical protein